MAVRTTDALIRGILDVDTAITDLDPFILIANEIVTEVCSDSSYTAARLVIIETWLAAHFTAIRDVRRDTERVGTVSEVYQYKVDLNLHQTQYGQQAMLIDTAGNLAALSKKMTDGIDTSNVGATWVGTEEDDL